MSAIFPTPLPDELLYSVIARFRDMVRFPDEKAVLEAAFGKRTGIAVFELTGALDALVSRLPPGHRFTADELLRCHTILPYYQRFIPVHRSTDAIRRLRKQGSTGLTELLGIRASTVPTPTHLRFCPTCAAEDLEMYGVPYWRRAHQLPGVLVCTRHGTALWRSAVRRTAPDGRHVFRNLREAQAGPSFPEPLNFGDTVLLLQLARDTDWLLTGPQEPQGLATLHRRYREHLEERGWMRTARRIRISELRDSFVACYGGRFLQRLGCALQGGEHDWLPRLLRRPRVAQHPLHHLLVIRFLGICAEDFFRDKVIPNLVHALHPDSGPEVLCRNPVCDTPGSRSARVIYDTRGIARCTSCGHTWRQTGGKVPRVQVLAFGSVWESELRRLVADPAVSLRGAAARLGVTPKTVRRHARRLGVWRAEWDAREAGRGDCRREAVKATAERHRRTWRRLRSEFPARSTSELRQEDPAAYSYLYRYDRQWLEANKPARVKTRPRAPRVDWSTRDAEMRGLAEEAVARILASPGRPVRLRLGTIARFMGHVPLLQQRLDRLPATRDYLASVIESPLAFAVRRLRWAAEQYAAEGEVPPAWALVRRAGLRPGMAAELRMEIERTQDHFRKLAIRAA